MSFEKQVYDSIDSLARDMRLRERKFKFELEKSQLEVQIYKTKLSEVNTVGEHCLYALIQSKDVGGVYSDYCLGIFRRKSQALSEQHKKMTFDPNTRQGMFSIKSFKVPENIELEDGKIIYIIYETGEGVCDKYYCLKELSFERPNFNINSNLYAEYYNLK